MYPSGKVYAQIIRPKILKRCNFHCEECGKRSFLWVTPVSNLLEWENLEVPEVAPLLKEQSTIRAVCYRCAHKYLPAVEKFRREFFKKTNQLKLSI